MAGRHPSTRQEEPSESPEPAFAVVQPVSFDDCRLLGEHFREGTPVRLDLSKAEPVVVGSVIDFAAGMVFALHGDMVREGPFVIALLPPGFRPEGWIDDSVAGAAGEGQETERGAQWLGEILSRRNASGERLGDSGDR
ncbi:cell division protein SepF [Actinopolymorpha alba]|uniref:cell division protein SepF n=1 Tax=Actinopolymorpha alba TaxID=533267 RepID=UPI003B50A550